MSVGIGIDLGTTTSEIAIYDPDIERPRVLDIEGQKIVPSVVWFDTRADRNTIVVGDVALNNQLLHSSDVVSSVKRQMGKSPSALQEAKYSGPRLPLTFQGRQYGPPQISAEILKYLALNAGNVGYPVRDVVITVPAEFNLRQREATVQAVEQADLNLLMLLPEPVAALLAYDGLDRERGQTVMVYDLGGGTLDCTLIRVEGADNEVLAKTGGMDIAGDAIDEIFYQQIESRFASQLKVTLSQEDAGLRQTVRTKCRSVKEKLSDAEKATFSLRSLTLKSGQVVNFNDEISRVEFHGWLRPILTAGGVQIAKALDEASLRPDDIARVLLVGGSTRVPAVREMVEKRFGEAKVLADLPPDLIVAQGAAKAAHALQQGQQIVERSAHAGSGDTRAWRERVHAPDRRGNASQQSGEQPGNRLAQRQPKAGYRSLRGGPGRHARGRKRMHLLQHLGANADDCARLNRAGPHRLQRAYVAAGVDGLLE